MKIEDTPFRVIDGKYFVRVGGSNIKGGTVHYSQKNRRGMSGYVDRTMRFTVGADKTGKEHLLSLSSQTGSVYYDRQRDGENKLLEERFMSVLNDFYRNTSLNFVSSKIYGKDDLVIADISFSNSGKLATRVIGSVDPKTMELNFSPAVLTKASQDQIDFINRTQSAVNFSSLNRPQTGPRGVFQFGTTGVLNTNLPEIQEEIKSIISTQMREALNQPPEYIDIKQTARNSLTFSGNIEAEMTNSYIKSGHHQDSTKIDTSFSGTYKDGKLSVQSKGFSLGNHAIESIQNECENYLDMAKLKESEKKREINGRG